MGVFDKILHLGEGRKVKALEAIVPDDIWPLPTYHEMLFIK